MNCSQAGLIVGVELGVDFVSVAVTDFLGNINCRRREDANPNEDQQKMIDQTLRIVKDALGSVKRKTPIF
ncbi:MAG: ROK family protein [Anaerolineales bacterium]|nr:ROK family protein [Anaerolineales bacterium]